MRVFFHLLYHQFSWSYDWVARIVSLGQWDEWIKCVLPFLSGRRVLELGHGPGHLQTALSERQISAFGLDESRQMGNIAYKRLRNCGPRPKLSRAYAQFLPFSGESFQQVVSTFPSEYISDHRTLREAHRVLVPGGDFVVLPMVWITGGRWAEKLMAWLFKVTEQTTPWSNKFLRPFSESGFDTRTEFVHRDTWTAVIILATKDREGD